MTGGILDRWDHVVDPRFGIIRQLRELEIDDDEPDFFHYLSTACDTRAFTALRNFGNNGGVGTTRPRAIAKAMGEAVERYCAAIFDDRELVRASYRELRDRATPPDAFSLYRPEQLAAPGFPWLPFTEETQVAWTRGRSLLDGDDVLVPAAAVHVPFVYRLALGDVPVMEPISTGLACGSSYETATCSALCEAVERDAFTITWQARLSRPRVPRRGLPAEVLDLLRRYEDVGLGVEIADITTDLGIPTLLTVAIGRAPTSPAIAVAAACDPSPTTALVKSLEELAHTRKYAAQLMDHTPEVPFDVAAGHPAVKTQREHLRAYCPQASIRHAEFLWASDESHELLRAEEPAPSLAALVARVSAAGLEPIACDLTTPDVADLGLAVIRVVVPGLHPLYMGHENRTLGGHRLDEVPARLGYEGPATGEPDNPYPHPFP
jgi:ribosomal protein S12 methylthiotransferase accessory factor